ncbi:MAG TPA: TerB family tellurite resistance protein [Candidatus Eisenbacteria bacterium]|nr:TerB family tellurite resistance protein [Candidatus Eisenbacteria bacterium]
MSIWKFLGIEGNARDPGSGKEGEAVRAIVKRLEGLDPERARHIAAFAYILGRVAHVDLEISDGEARAMERILVALGGIAEDEATLVVQIAKTQHVLFGATENYVVTRDFGRTAAGEEKAALLECLFAVSASDEDVSGDEENEIRKIARELDMSHSEFIEARMKFREHIAALKGMDRPPT